MELLVQTHYCLQYYKMNDAVFCLTDVFNVWHYFKIELSKRSPKMVIRWYHKIEGDIATWASAHLVFLKEIIRGNSFF